MMSSEPKIKESQRTESQSAERTAPDEVVALYRRAFAEHRARALWNVREYDTPTMAQALAITRQLRTEGDLAARRLAEEIETAARANH